MICLNCCYTQKATERTHQPTQIKQFRDISLPTVHLFTHHFFRYLPLTIHDIQKLGAAQITLLQSVFTASSGQYLTVFLQTELWQVTHFPDTRWERIKEDGPGIVRQLTYKSTSGPRGGEGERTAEGRGG